MQRFDWNLTYFVEQTVLRIMIAIKVASCRRAVDDSLHMYTPMYIVYGLGGLHILDLVGYQASQSTLHCQSFEFHESLTGQNY